MIKFVGQCEKLGISLAHIAEEMGMSRQSVSAWYEVPEAHVPIVSRITGIARRNIRPDLYEMIQE